VCPGPPSPRDPEWRSRLDLRAGAGLAPADRGKEETRPEGEGGVGHPASTTERASTREGCGAARRRGWSDARSVSRSGYPPRGGWTDPAYPELRAKVRLVARQRPMCVRLRRWTPVHCTEFPGAPPHSTVRAGWPADDRQHRAPLPATQPVRSGAGFRATREPHPANPLTMRSEGPPWEGTKGPRASKAETPRTGDCGPWERSPRARRPRPGDVGSRSRRIAHRSAAMRTVKGVNEDAPGCSSRDTTFHHSHLDGVEAAVLCFPHGRPPA
jgi:hypothetical protein